jgi:hypothetical protein
VKKAILHPQSAKQSRISAVDAAAAGIFFPVLRTLLHPSAIKQETFRLINYICQNDIYIYTDTQSFSNNLFDHEIIAFAFHLHPREPLVPFCGACCPQTNKTGDWPKKKNKNK